MAKGIPISELPLTEAHSRRGNSNTNVIHPVELEAGSRATVTSATTTPNHTTTTPSPIVPYSQIKHFEKHYSWIVPSFVVINTIMFIITMYVNNCHKNSESCIVDFLGRFSFQPMKENPLLGPSSTTLQKMGALDVKKVVDDDQVWRIFTCIWLHGGVFHLLANMLSLLVIGIRLEHEFGFVRIGVVYVIAGLGGSILSGLFIQSNISVGASGALFGLLGSMLSELFTNWTIYANKFAVLMTLMIIIAINLAVGILPHVDNFAHIGGFVSGFLLGFVFLMRPHFGWVSQRYALVEHSSNAAKPKFKTYQWILCVISIVLLIILFVAGLVMLLRGENLNDNCSWCHNLSCVSTSLWNCDNQNISCLSEQLGNQLTITCSNNNRTATYMLADPSNTRIQGLCSQLCR